VTNHFYGDVGAIIQDNLSYASVTILSFVRIILLIIIPARTGTAGVDGQSEGQMRR